MLRFLALSTLLATSSLASAADEPKSAPTKPIDDASAPKRIVRSEREWQRRLSRSEFLVCRMKMTETPFTGKYANHHGVGVYRCVACEAPLFSSDAKFDSGTGWPSFFQVVGPRQIHTGIDNSAAEPRIEVTCARCDSHLGHVFNDGPAPTGLRYCINSVALKFEDAAEKKKEETEAATKKFEEKPPDPPPPGEKRLEFK